MGHPKEDRLAVLGDKAWHGDPDAEDAGCITSGVCDGVGDEDSDGAQVGILMGIEWDADALFAADRPREIDTDRRDVIGT